MDFQLVWFDSMGAKSSCTLVKTDDTSILIDPGAAIMQPSFPLPGGWKAHFVDLATKAIVEASRGAEHIVISHYHYDHHTLEYLEIYKGKKLWVKDPNRWINISQWWRARLFLEKLCKALGGVDLRSFEVDPGEEDFPDPLESLPLLGENISHGYRGRWEELLEKGRKSFQRLTQYWMGHRWVREPKLGDTVVSYADGGGFRVGGTRVRFTKPVFHGIEFSRTGWVFSTIIEHGGVKLIHTSDLEGPIIEDYAQWLIDEKPDILILDGPTTYLLGYLLNMENLGRSLKNISRIVEEGDIGLIIYDHHLLRDPLFRERTKGIWGKVTTAAEYRGGEPLVLRAARGEFKGKRPP